MTDPIREPGLYDLSHDRYHSDPCETPSLSSGIANMIVQRSELHARLAHPRLGGRGRIPTREMDRGSIIHKMLLGKGADVVTIEADDYRSKAAQQARDAAHAAGKIPALPKELEACGEAHAAISLHLEREGVVLDGMSEIALIWYAQTSEGEPVICRTLIDHLVIGDDHFEVFDLKSSGKVCSPKKVARKIEDDGAHVQAIAHLSAVGAVFPHLQGRGRYTWIAAEMEPPYAVCLAEPDGSMTALGVATWQEGVNRWAAALRDDKWPGYPRTRVAASPWALKEIGMEG